MKSDNVYKKLESVMAEIRRRTDFVPETGLTLGSGLGNFTERMDVECVIPYGEIGMPVSTVTGHKGEFVFGRVEGVKVMAQSGRAHCYEGYSSEESASFVRIMRMAGAKRVILTNAAGGVNPDFRAGDLMLISDHISCFVENPLKGRNVDELGTRFPDMSEVYDRELSDIMFREAANLGIRLKSGVYMQLGGPSYETPAEIRMCRILGADAVGMSTATEAIAAVHAGLKVVGISCITNKAAGCGEKLSHDEVKKAADEIAPKFGSLVSAFIKSSAGVP